MRLLLLPIFICYIGLSLCFVPQKANAYEQTDHSPLNQKEISYLLQELGALRYNYNLQEDVHRAMTSDHFTLRAYAATYLGRYGTAESIPYLINALSDNSLHVGANYIDAGMATTRHRANIGLKYLVKEDFGFQWDSPEEERQAAIAKWNEWLDERNMIIKKVESYLIENNMKKYHVYSAHLNHDKTEWSTALTETPPKPGAPVLIINRKTYEIKLIHGR